ncbi:MAG: alpha/beta hydrolase [Phycisphaerae bacterium]
MNFTIDGVRIACDVAGSGPVSVVFVHGFPLTREMWRPTVSRLARRARCIAPDLRGHGRSAASDAVTITRFADDLAELLDALGEPGPVVVCGLSMGGIIAFEFFRRHRARVAALALCDTRANAESPEGVARREALAAAVLREGSQAAASAMIGTALAPTASATLRDEVFAMMASNSRVGVAAAARALATRPDSFPTLPQIDVPTLVVVGAEDAITPVDGLVDIQRRIRGARLVVIPGAGHVPPMEQPEAFAQALDEFLDGLAGPATGGPVARG